MHKEGAIYRTALCVLLPVFLNGSAINVVLAVVEREVAKCFSELRKFIFQAFFYDRNAGDEADVGIKKTLEIHYRRVAAVGNQNCLVEVKAVTGFFSLFPLAFRKFP